MKHSVRSRSKERRRSRSRSRSRSPQRRNGERYKAEKYHEYGDRESYSSSIRDSQYRTSDHYRKRRTERSPVGGERWQFERESIAVKGAPEVWGLSPKEPTTDSEEEATIHRNRNSSSGKLLLNDSSDETHKKAHKMKKKAKKMKKNKKHKKKLLLLKAEKGGKNPEDNLSSTLEALQLKKLKRKYIGSSSNDSDNSSESNDDKQEDDWVEKADSSNVIVGPSPIVISEVQQPGLKEYGHALLPGEGEAMADYVRMGKRIPRRGEIGLTSDEIADFESAGYVMSGSRHRRMEAVRLRKENQVYSADEKRALAMFNREERSKRENKVLADFRELVHKKVKKQ
eukprot:gene11429-12619_t